VRRYADKRNFDKTPEPAEAHGEGEGPLRFCVQKHAARRLHYDLRIEMGGTLVCWAVPHGPSLNPADKRLAVHVEDHPLEYLDFEGVIPKGQYGGGQMVLWDRGVYSPDEGGVLSFDDRAEADRRMQTEFSAGKLSFTLRGSKLAGSWTLVKTTRNEQDWLLIKHRDEFASASRDVLKEDRSVLSGLSIEDLRDGRSAAEEFDASDIAGAVRATLPRSPQPMLCTEADKPFSKPDWTFQVKLDGIRMLALGEDRKVKLLSRRGNDITGKFPAIARELAACPHRSFVLDGEVVLYNSRGVPDFQGLMERFQLASQSDILRQDLLSPVEYCVFDLLFLDGWDMRGCALSDRRAALEGSDLQGAQTRLLDFYPEIGELLYDKARDMGFEGIVAKKSSSRYVEGRRSPDWLKIKEGFSDEFVIVGYTEADSARRDSFRSLVLAEFNAGQFVFAGTVGGGFSDDALKTMRTRLDAMTPGACPFGEAPDLEGVAVHWLTPALWIEVRYGARTREGRLRFPVFVRVREDLPPPDKGSGEAEPMSQVDDWLAQLDDAKQDTILVVDGCSIHFSNLDRVFWPATDQTAPVTKRDLARYYLKVSGHILPQLRDRPLSLVRCPDGILGEHFFQKHWDKGLPEWVDRVPVWSDHNGRAAPYVVCNSVATLLWMAQMGVLEIHPWYSRYASGPEGLSLTTSDEAAMDASALSYPDFLVVDLDPTLPKDKETDPDAMWAGFKMSVEVALRFKTMLDELQLEGFAKTSGKTGIHIFIPIIRNLEFSVVRALAETLGRHLESLMPDKVTMEWVVKKRPEKVFFDHNQNVRGKTLAGIFSPRPVPGAPVSFPLSWARLRTIRPEQFTVASAPAALVNYGDPWERLMAAPQDLRRLGG